MVRWQMSHRADPAACLLADRHYSRQSVGYTNMMPPGRCIVFVTPGGDAVWGTAWPFAKYVKHAWAGAWMCTIFRNESRHLSSELIREAVAATRWLWPDPPELGMVTFVDGSKVRRKRDPGRCFLRAGFAPVGKTKGGLYAFQMLPDVMPAAEAPLGLTLSLFGITA
jgi:hypothetical protein